MSGKPRPLAALAMLAVIGGGDVLARAAVS